MKSFMLLAILGVVLTKSEYHGWTSRKFGLKKSDFQTAIISTDTAEPTVNFPLMESLPFPTTQHTHLSFFVGDLLRVKYLLLDAFLITKDHHSHSLRVQFGHDQAIWVQQLVGMALIGSKGVKKGVFIDRV